jgi:uncharacterized membrane protein YidH (DUF202 family)
MTSRDIGAQPERTALAWRRTALALVVGSVVAARLTAPVLGVLAVAMGVVGAGLAAAVWGSAGRRYAVVRRCMDEERPLDGSAGPALAATAAVCTVVGLLAMVFVATRGT